MSTTTTAAFFDLDGTLCTGHIWKGLSSYCRTRRANLHVYYPFFFFHMALWLLYKAHLGSERTFVYRWGKDMAVLVKGLSKEQGQGMFRWIVEQEVTSTLREDVLDRLRWHQNQGHTVVLVSGAFQEILELVGHDLGVQYAVGTALRVRRGHYTGGIDGPFCFGEDKARLLLSFLNKLGQEIDLGSSYAYADRIYDLPMLEMVGNPVAVYPDERLKAHAEGRGWGVVDGETVEAR